MRQHNSSSVRKQTRGNEISSALLQNLGNKSKYQIKGCTYSWEVECFRRSFEQGNDQTNRMDVEQRNSSDNFSNEGTPIGNHVCISSQSSNSNIFYVVSPQSSLCTRCSNNSLGRDVSLCIFSLCLIPKVLQHIRQYNCQVILIAPFCPRRPCYTELLQLLAAVPLNLPNCPQLLQQPNTKIFHPNVEEQQLTAWLLSSEASKKRTFLKTLEPDLQQVRGQAPKKIMLANSNNLIAGVVQGKLIPIQHL